MEDPISQIVNRLRDTLPPLPFEGPPPEPKVRAPPKLASRTPVKPKEHKPEPVVEEPKEPWPPEEGMSPMFDKWVRNTARVLEGIEEDELRRGEGAKSYARKLGIYHGD